MPVDEQTAWLLGELFREVGIGIAILDRDLRFVMVNRTIAALNGVSVDGHVGRSIEEITPHLTPAVAPLLRRVLTTGEAIESIELVAAAREPGVLRHYLNTYTPIRRHGEVVAVGAIVIDRTAQHDAESALRKSEARFRAICEASPVGIFLTDPTGASLYSNPVNLAQMGLTQEEACGSGWQRAIHPDDRARVIDRFGAATSNRGTYDSVDRYQHPGGRIVPIAVKARGVYDGDTLLGFVGMVEDITERLRAEEALRESELRFRQVAENIGSVFWLIDRTTIHYVSPAYAEIWGRPVEELHTDRMRFLHTVHPDDRRIVANAFCTWDRDYELEYRIVRPDGSLRWISDRSFLVRDATGAVVRKAGIASDVTNQKALEAQLLQSRKLESIGRLAGGIAHDFNNLLTVILAQVKMAARAFEHKRSATEELTQIEEAATRAAELTRQLLTFARRQPTYPSVLDLTQVARDIDKLLRRLIGENIELVSRLDPDAGLVRADRTQLEQVLVNLAVNARDAMSAGGTLTIETAAVHLDGRADVAPGPYVMLRVSDTGCGIADEHRAHIFEPFFTTKQPGEGTGLGLATCYGIVKQHNGHIELTTKIGQGTAFRVFLPRVDSTAEASGRPHPSARPRGTETVLVVEDDAAVRAIALQALRERGFRVIGAAHGLEARELLAEHRTHVDVVVTDVVMPELGGRELAEWIRRERPELPILFTSGYQDVDLPGERWSFLQKPYVPATLVQRVCELLATFA